MKPKEIRAKYPSFVYKSHSHVLTDKGLKLSFEFAVSHNNSNFSKDNEENITFHPTITIHQVTQKHLDQITPELLHNWIFHIGLMEIPSYWKATTSPAIVISQEVLPPQGFKKKQATWFKNLLLQGLGEFFYVNDIDFTSVDYVKFVVEDENQAESAPLTSLTNHSPTAPSSATPSKILVPVGGGKDSALTLGILDRNSIPYSTFLLEPHSPSTADIIASSNSQATLTATRIIDKKLLDLNQKGYLNGHTPFSAYLAFLSSFVAQLFNFDEIFLSNEHSANEGNTLFHDVMVNHQYSKSVEFEKAFQEYTREYIYGLAEKTSSTDNSNFQESHHCHPRYFSFLRPLYEIQIAKLFAEYDQFHSSFRSCNVGQKKGVWCHSCPKCLFVFAMMFPFIETEKLTNSIFSSNLYEDPSLLDTAKELIGITDKKPFECVGTHEESTIAFFLSIQKHKKEHPDEKLPLILEYIDKKILPREQNLEQRTQEILNSWNGDHTLSPEMESLLRGELISNKLCCLFEDKDIAILGFGKEGKSTQEFLQKYLPDASVAILDQTQGDDYLDDIDKFDVIFKSPGIPTTLPELQKAFGLDEFHDANRTHTSELYSNTRLFFELCPGKIIGVTGTKGKSTTSSLTHHLLGEIFRQNNKNIQNKNNYVSGKNHSDHLQYKVTPGYNTVLVGNIGEPPLSQLNKISSQTYVVNELSSHQLAELKISPHIAIVQEITSEHLDYYQTVQEYREAKSSIARYQKSNDFIIYNPRFEHTKDISELSGGDKISFTDTKYIIEPVLPLDELPLLGNHNLENIAPAILAVQLVMQEIEDSTKDKLVRDKNNNDEESALSTALKSFQTLPHRMQKLIFPKHPDFDKKTNRLNGVLYINDSLSTTPESAQAAISSFSKNSVILLAGGYERHQDYAELAKTILEYKVKKLILFHDTGERLWDEIEKYHQELQQSKENISLPEHTFVNSMREAVKEAQDAAQNGDVVLLSPAAASFNTFKDYAERGELFQSEIKKQNS